MLSLVMMLVIIPEWSGFLQQQMAAVNTADLMRAICSIWHLLLHGIGQQRSVMAASVTVSMYPW